MLMIPGTKVRLVDRRLIDTTALLCRPACAGEYFVVKIEVGDIGTVRTVGPDGLFEVTFDHCAIICNDTMVEAVVEA